MLVTKLMSTQLVCVGLDTRLAVLVDLFDKHHFHHLLVVDDAKLIGVVSDRDLLKALNPRAGSAFATSKEDACLNKPVHQIMSRNPIVVQTNQSVLTAVKVFNRESISVLPVVDKNGAPVGILSWRDIFRGIERTFG